jgi:large subunit ribosomal protein L13
LAVDLPFVTIVKEEPEPMSTFMANAATVEHKWYVVDAEGKPLGRLAADVAVLLNGKHKVDYTPHADCGDFVIVVNADKVVLTGKKLTQKYYRTHSGYAGGLKEVQYKNLMSKRPEMAVMLAVKGMLPKNGIGRNSLKRLKVYAGAEHPHAAQKPEAYEGGVK